MNSLHALDCSLVGTPGWPLIGSLDCVDSDVLWDGKSVVLLLGTLSAGNLFVGNTCMGIPLDGIPSVGDPCVGIPLVVGIL